MKQMSWLMAVMVLLTSCGHDDALELALPAAEAADASASAAIAAEKIHDETGSLPLPKRLAFMTGHVQAGLALYRAGAPEMAAPHLLHPVSETHVAERKGLDSLGFNGALFISVSQALENGVAASDIEPQLAAAEANLAEVAARAGGDPTAIIHFLLDTTLEEYAIGVTDGVVTDMGEYQDAYGFTKAAIDLARTLPMPIQSDVVAALVLQLELWHGAPIPPKSPASLADLQARSSVVYRLLDRPMPK